MKPGLYVRQHPQGPDQLMRVTERFVDGQTELVLEYEAWEELRFPSQEMLLEVLPTLGLKPVSINLGEEVTDGG